MKLTAEEERMVREHRTNNRRKWMRHITMTLQRLRFGSFTQKEFAAMRSEVKECRQRMKRGEDFHAWDHKRK